MEKADIASLRKGNVVKDDSPNTVSRKRTADGMSEASPSKTTKPIRDDFCVYVGNLNNWKAPQEIKDSLAVYFMTHSLICQEIKLDPSRKHAFVDMASEMDLNKALALDGEEILDKPMKIAKAKVKSNDNKKVKCPQVDKEDGRCLFLKNVPYSVTKEDIKKVFHKAVAVRFLGGAKSPDKGIAFVEFQNKTIAKKMLGKKRSAKILGRDVIVEAAGKRNVPKGRADKNTEEAAPLNNVLFVSNLPTNVRENQLKKVFKTAVRISIPQAEDKPKRYAFVEFGTVTDAEKVLLSSKHVKIGNKVANIDVCRNKMKPESEEVSVKTLFVAGLASNTTAETLKSAFDGAVSARLVSRQETGDSKRFGFVDFESEENCRAARAAAADCLIDGSKVTVHFALSKGGRGPRTCGDVSK